MNLSYPKQNIVTDIEDCGGLSGRKSCLAFLLLMRTTDRPLVDRLSEARLVRLVITPTMYFLAGHRDPAQQKIKSEKVHLNWERSLMGVFIFIRRKWEQREGEISKVDRENNEAASLPPFLSSFSSNASD